MDDVSSFSMGNGSEEKMNIDFDILNNSNFDYSEYLKEEQYYDKLFSSDSKLFINNTDKNSILLKLVDADMEFSILSRKIMKYTREFDNISIRYKSFANGIFLRQNASTDKQRDKMAYNEIARTSIAMEYKKYNDIVILLGMAKETLLIKIDNIKMILKMV